MIPTITRKHWTFRSFTEAVLLLILVLSSSAQWVNYKPPGIPRTADGKPDINAPAPKNADGRPDISGVWVGPRPYQTNLTKDLKPGELVMTPWAEALFKQRRANEARMILKLTAFPAVFRGLIHLHIRSKSSVLRTS